MSIDFNNKKFAVFMDDNCKLAFLEINEEGKYKYPQLRDLLLLTEVLDSDGQMVKVVAWYDNEMGYSHQMVRTARKIGKM